MEKSDLTDRLQELMKLADRKELESSQEHTIGPIYGETWQRFKIFKLTLELQTGKKYTNNEALKYLLDLYYSLVEIQDLMGGDSDGKS